MIAQRLKPLVSIVCNLQSPLAISINNKLSSSLSSLYFLSKFPTRARSPLHLVSMAMVARTNTERIKALKGHLVEVVSKVDGGENSI